MNKILLVDDDRELTSLLKELLEMEGFNIVVAHDGEQALSLLDSSIDLLLLDIMMPKQQRRRQRSCGQRSGLYQASITLFH